MAIHFLFKAHPVATAHMYRVKRDRPHQSLHILKNVAATLDTTGSKLDLILMVFDDKMTLFNSLNGSIAYRVCNNMTLQSSFKKGDPSPETLIKKKNYSSVSPLLQKIRSSMPKLLYKYILKFFTIFFW